MLKLLNRYRTEEDGVISVEFGMIAPMLIFATLFAVNMGYKVNKHQKLASAVAAGSNYLQDYTAEFSLDDLRPTQNDDGTQSDSQAVLTTKQVIQSAYGSSLELGEIYSITYCGCYKPNIDSGETTEGEDVQTEPSNQEFDFADPSQPFYTRTQVSTYKKGELCAFDCPGQQGRARVILELNVNHQLTDLFGKNTYINEQIKMRLR